MKEFKKAQKDLHTLEYSAWQKRGEGMAMKLFHHTAKHVPAYKKFLKSNLIDPTHIRTISDFKKVPCITKENYLNAFPFHELLPEKNLGEVRMISTSSGSSGMPFFWPRTTANQTEAALIHELFLTEFFNIDKKRTLFINTFAMGMWVAGTTTFEAIESVGKKYDLTLVCPGIDVDQILRTVTHVGKYYQQIIIAGYPPFVKDVIQSGSEAGISWKEHSVRLLFAAESFSEDWRDGIHAMAGIKTAELSASLNIYGTADALIVAHETPLTVLLRKKITANAHLHKALFGHERRVPTLAQYNPEMRYIEEMPGSKLIFSSASGIPLVRYDIGDTGNISSVSELRKKLSENGIDLTKEIRSHGIKDKTWDLPIVTIYGRDRMTASLYGLKIYPEHIHGALDGKVSISLSSGRFVMITKNDNKNDQYLEINIELNPGIKRTAQVKTALKNAVQKNLLRVNSEYKKLHQTLGDRIIPRLVLHPHKTSDLFSRMGKQRWKV